MAGKDLKTKFATFDSGQLQKWLAWILSAGAGAVAATFLLYFANFNGDLSKDQAQWGAFGDFVGGTLNPTLSFLGLIALLLTVLLQGRQIELSRQELQATRQELARSAKAQEMAEKSQAKQAQAQELSTRLTALTALLNATSSDLDRANDGHASSGAKLTAVGRVGLVSQLAQEKRALIDDLKEIAYREEKEECK